MKIDRGLVPILMLAALTACDRGAETANVTANTVAPTTEATVNTTPREPQEILCNMGQCTYLRVDKQDLVTEAGGERLYRVTSAEGTYSVPEDTSEFPKSSRGLAISWSPQPNDYYVLCSKKRPTLIVGKAAPAIGWEGHLLDFVDSVNFASMDYFVHYSAVCQPGDPIDDGFAKRHGLEKVEGTSFDLQRPEDALKPRS